MVLSVQRSGNYYNKTVEKVENKVAQTPVNHRNQLANLLFGRSLQHSKDITFGWSQGLPQVEEKILDALTDPDISRVVVASHTVPDGDAYGSNIGICGILESMGVRTYPVVDGKPTQKFEKMPSARANKTALAYIKRPGLVSAWWQQDGIKQVDLAVITDCSVPDRITDEVFDLISKAKKVILIDHHKDNDNMPPNYDQWLAKLRNINYGLSEDKIFYWRDADSTSASEMVAELDKEITDEYKSITDEAKSDTSGWVNRYNPRAYHGYRLAMATGILTDTGTTPPKTREVPQFRRTSSKKVLNQFNKPVNATEAYYMWLVNKSGEKKVDMKKVSQKKLPGRLYSEAEDIAKGKIRVKGIEVHPSNSEKQFSYVYVDDWRSLNGIADYMNGVCGGRGNGKRSRGGKRNTSAVEITARDVYDRIKASSKKRFHSSKSELLLIATNNYKEKSFGLSIVSKDSGLAERVAAALTKAGFGEGGGHADACGFRALPEKHFKDTFPVIANAIKEFKEEKLAAIKEEEEAKAVSEPSDDKVTSIDKARADEFDLVAFLGRKLNLSI